MMPWEGDGREVTEWRKQKVIRYQELSKKMTD